MNFKYKSVNKNYNNNKKQYKVKKSEILLKVVACISDGINKIIIVSSVFKCMRLGYLLFTFLVFLLLLNLKFPLTKICEQ